MNLRLYIITFCLLFAGLALHGQAPEKRFVGNCRFSGFTLLADSSYRGDIINFTDRMGDGYNLTQLAVGYEIFDGRGLVFEIDTIHESTNFTADVSVTARVDRGFAPFGSGQVYQPTANGLIPPSSQEQAGLSPTQKARIDRHNVVVMQSLIGGRDSVYSITNVPDTSSLSPVMGDIFINAAGDTMGVYSTSWVLFFGGGIPGSGTTGNLARWASSSSLTDADITDNGTVINIGASRDEVTVEATDSVLVDGPVVNVGGQPSATVRVSDTDETVTVQAGSLEQKIVVDDFGLNVQADGGSYYLATGSPPVDGKNHVQAWFNGSAQWLNLTDSLAVAGAGDNLGDHTATTTLNLDGNNVQLAGGYVIGGTGTGSDLVFQTTTGAGDVGSDVIFLNGNNGGDEAMRIKGDGDVGIGTSSPFQTLHVQGTARITGSDGTPTALMGRDGDGDIGAVTLGTGLTLSGGELSATGGGGISGTLTDDTLPVYEASGDTLTDSYLSQVADGLVLAANKYLQITGWATAGEPVAGVGLFGYDTDNDVFRMSDGVSWFSPAGVSKTSGKFTQNRIPYADVNGLLTDDANFNFTSGTLNCPATVTISGSGATVRVTNQNAKTYVFGQGLVLNTFTIGYGFGGFGISVTEQNRVGIGISNQTARFQLPAGTATASTAPFKFTLTGHVPLTTPEAGVLSPNAAFDRLSYTNNSAVRKELAFTDDISNIDTADLNLASTGNESWPLQFNLAGYDDGMEFRYDEGSDSDLGDRVGTIQWRPRYGGSIQNEVAAITGIYDGDGTTRKGRLRFFTHNGSSFIKALDLSNDSILVDADYTRFNNGSVGINTSGAPTAQLEVNGTVKVTGITTLLSAVNMTGTSALQVHTGTTAQRPGTPVQGQIRTNTDNDTVEGYDGTKWKALDNKAYTPTSTADSYGSEGDIVYDDDYIYIKTSAGWKRSALSTF